MFEKLLILTSILLNTVGFRSAALNIDRNIIQQEVNPSIRVEASGNLTLPDISIKPRIDQFAPDPQIASESHILVDEESGTILSKENPNEKLPIASTTKMMTATLALENYNLDDIVTISEAAASDTLGADRQTVAGEKITVRNLLHVLLINSSNRAAYALAEHMNQPGETGVSKFVAAMNQKAQELGMLDTHYADPAGLNDDLGHSTAYNLYLIAKYALQNQTFASIVKTKTETVTDQSGYIKYSLSNSNRLVNEWNYPGAIGVKTGFTNGASHCLVAAVERNNHTLISVVLHTNLTGVTAVAASALESKKLLDWGFKYTRWGDEKTSEIKDNGIINTSTDSTSAIE